MAFTWGAGTLMGADHRRTGRSNQDSWLVTETRQGLIAMVSDGCGSCPHSEVGAKLGLRILAKSLVKQLEKEQLCWAEVQSDLLANLRTIVQMMSGDPLANIHDYFLFTIVGCIITEETTTIFSAGDGYFAINGEWTAIPAMSGNCPSYLSLNLLEEHITNSFQIHIQTKTILVESIILASDGIEEILSTELTDDLITNPFYQKNLDGLRRKLTLLSRQCQIPDDTTIVVVRRNFHE
jgi:serine/threonine protein phosphatase PrpC